ncbi:hypothetical protein ACFQ3W_03005 [Paenibacillus puldeungensis]|uniref:Yip1 domain-containing protein n=1 Tax=Paenibacillus puldeungensis TaxID=696536 RepID=A0ABW3RS86_9BACL
MIRRGLIALGKAAWSPLSVMDQEHTPEKQLASLLVVLMTAGLTAFLSADLYLLVAGVGTWAIACGCIWLVSRIFRKGIGFRQVSTTWGLTYLPNLICVAANYFLATNRHLTELPVLSFLIQTLLIMLLVWKAILYFIEMRCVLQVTGTELTIGTVIVGIVFLPVMMVGFILGLQVPML